MLIRKATKQEITEDLQFYIDHNIRVRFRHFVRELYNPRAANGVSHRQFSRAKVQIINGTAMVRRHGNLEELIANHVTTNTGRTMIANYRLAGLDN